VSIRGSIFCLCLFFLGCPACRRACLEAVHSRLRILSAGKDLNRELWTSDEFLDWLELGVFADLIDGEKIMHSPVSLKHANLVNFLDNVLRLYLESRSLGRLYRESVAVRLSSRNTFLPDLAYFRSEQVNQLGETFI